MSLTSGAEVSMLLPICILILYHVFILNLRWINCVLVWWSLHLQMSCFLQKGRSVPTKISTLFAHTQKILSHHNTSLSLESHLLRHIPNSKQKIYKRPHPNAVLMTFPAEDTQPRLRQRHTMLRTDTDRQRRGDAEIRRESFVWPTHWSFQLCR